MKLSDITSNDIGRQVIYYDLDGIEVGRGPVTGFSDLHVYVNLSKPHNPDANPYACDAYGLKWETST